MAPRRRTELAARREARGYTQEGFALELGLEPRTIRRWEQGTLKPQPWRRHKIARALDVTLDELDALLTSTQEQAWQGRSVASRREVIFDAALLTGAAIAGRVVGGPAEQPVDITGASALVTRLHQDYQAARYSQAAQTLPSVAQAVDALVISGSSTDRAKALRLQCSVSIAAAKLANKAGDATAASAAADRARIAAESAEHHAGLAAADHQRTCALLRAGLSDEAERLAMSSIEEIRGADPESLTWRGALTLISAIIAACRNDRAEAAHRLNLADDLANQLGEDGNIGWTAFGPTNVLIHRLSAAVELDDPYGPLSVAERVDITKLPNGLHGRQAQFHLESAWAHAQLGEDAHAVIHLLDTERVAAVVAAPLTFNSINKWAAGISDSLALGVLNEMLGAAVPIVAAPCVKPLLRKHPAYRESVTRLTNAGVSILDPDTVTTRADDGLATFDWPQIEEALAQSLS